MRASASTFTGGRSGGRGIKLGDPACALRSKYAEEVRFLGSAIFAIRNSAPGRKERCLGGKEKTKCTQGQAKATKSTKVSKLVILITLHYVYSLARVGLEPPTFFFFFSLSSLSCTSAQRPLNTRRTILFDAFRGKPSGAMITRCT